MNKVVNLMFPVLLTGCSVSPTYVDDSQVTDNAAPKPLNPVHFKIEEGFKTQPPMCIAVMPLTNKVEEDENAKENKKFKLLTLSDESMKQLRWSLYSQLAPYPFQDVELAKVDQVMASMQNKADYQKIGQALQCDALLLGEVTDYQSGFFGIYSQTSIGVDMKLIRAKDGEVLWQGNHTAVTRAGGLPFSPLGLIEGLYEATTNLNEEQLRRVEDDVFRRLLFTWNSIMPIIEQRNTKVQLASHHSDEAHSSSDKALYVIAVNNLYLRSGPGTRYKAKAVLSQKNTLKVLNKKYQPWVEVKVDNGKLGYVNKKYLKVLSNQEQVAALDK